MLRCAEKEHQSSGFSVITCWTTGDYYLSDMSSVKTSSLCAHKRKRGGGSYMMVVTSVFQLLFVLKGKKS